jgi:hypothetical protein
MTMPIMTSSVTELRVHRHVLRLASAIGVAGILLHLVLAYSHRFDPVVAGIMLLLSVVCAPCLIRLWRRRDIRTAGIVLGTSVGMILSHIAWMGYGGMQGHQHSLQPVHSVAIVYDPLVLMLWLTLEFGCAALCAAVLRTAGRRVPSGGFSASR